MESSEEKDGKDKEMEIEISKNNIDVEKKEREVKRQSAKFERAMRRDFDKHLARQIKSYESLLRNEIPQSVGKNRQIVFMVVDTGMKLPIYMFNFSVDNSFNSISFAQELNGRMQDYLNSEQFFSLQKKMYYRLKKLGVEPSEIYPQIEPRYSTMDSKSKKILRNNLTKWFVRQNSKTRGDKKDKLSPPSEQE